MKSRQEMMFQKLVDYDCRMCCLSHMYTSRESREKQCQEIKEHYRAMGARYVEMRYEDLFGRGA